MLKTKDISEMCAYLYSEKTGLKMEVYTDLPGLQLYSGNYISDTPRAGKNVVVYQKGDGLSLESQYFPDAINQPNFEKPIIKAGKLYKTTTIYKFSVEI